MMNALAPDLKATGSNVKDLTETVRTEPWRLVWPSTKKYPEDQPRCQRHHHRAENDQGATPDTVAHSPASQVVVP